MPSEAIVIDQKPNKSHNLLQIGRDPERDRRYDKRRSPDVSQAKLQKENEYLHPEGRVYTKCRRLVRVDEQTSKRWNV